MVHAIKVMSDEDKLNIYLKVVLEIRTRTRRRHSAYARLRGLPRKDIHAEYREIQFRYIFDLRNGGKSYREISSLLAISAPCIRGYYSRMLRRGRNGHL